MEGGMVERVVGQLSDHERSGEGKFRNRMRDHAVLIHKILRENDKFALTWLANEIGASELTARRWINTFSAFMPVRIDCGLVIIDRGPAR